MATCTQCGAPMRSGAKFCFQCSLREVHIPNSVTVIEQGAFSGCTSLREVYLGNHVWTIGDNSFSCRIFNKTDVKKSKEVWLPNLSAASKKRLEALGYKGPI